MRFRRRYVIAVAVALAAAGLVVGCSSGGSKTATSTPSNGTQGGGGASTTVALTAKSLQYDKHSITLPANTQVTVTLNNQDAGVSHNFAVYKDKSASTKIFGGDLVTGPATKDYSFSTPGPGSYYFRCDVHPDTMNGTLTVK